MVCIVLCCTVAEYFVTDSCRNLKFSPLLTTPIPADREMR